jgi:hypothetical protein
MFILPHSSTLTVVTLSLTQFTGTHGTWAYMQLLVSERLNTSIVSRSSSSSSSNSELTVAAVAATLQKRQAAQQLQQPLQQQMLS